MCCIQLNEWSLVHKKLPRGEALHVQIHQRSLFILQPHIFKEPDPFVTTFYIAQPKPAGPYGSCPSGYEDKDPSHPYCYRVEVMNESDHWWEAQNMCQQNGSSLASIHSQTIQDVLYHQMMDKQLLKAWIGVRSDRKL